MNPKPESVPRPLDEIEQRQAEIYLFRSGWKKDFCGWWIAPFGYSRDEAIALHREVSERDAYAMNSGDKSLLKAWLDSESDRGKKGRLR